MRDIYHYDLIKEFNEVTYKDVLNVADISGDEIAIKYNAGEPNEEVYFYYPVKKKLNTFLLPSEQVENMPIFVDGYEKISNKSKGYLRINSCKSVKITAVKTKPYHQFINDFMAYKHLEPDMFTLWKIITFTALDCRINVRAISYPGWLKDSPLTVIQHLTGLTATVNKPSLAKVKYLLNGKLQVLGLNEIQSLKSDCMEDLSKFYEDTGDFKPEYENPKRGQGIGEKFDVRSLSTLTFYNFPSTDEEKAKMFDFIFHPKIVSRIFPILLKGGSNNVTACKQTFPHITEHITEEERLALLEVLRNIQYWRENWMDELKLKPYKSSVKFDNTRWDRNWQTIMSHVALYAESEDEFKKYENLLYESHLAYLDYVQQNKDGFTKINIVEENLK